jgi:hypothetical protein
MRQKGVEQALLQLKVCVASGCLARQSIRAAAELSNNG